MLLRRLDVPGFEDHRPPAEPALGRRGRCRRPEPPLTQTGFGHEPPSCAPGRCVITYNPMMLPGNAFRHRQNLGLRGRKLRRWSGDSRCPGAPAEDRRRPDPAARVPTRVARRRWRWWACRLGLGVGDGPRTQPGRGPRGGAWGRREPSATAGRRRRFAVVTLLVVAVTGLGWIELVNKAQYGTLALTRRSPARALVRGHLPAERRRHCRPLDRRRADVLEDPAHALRATTCSAWRSAAGRSCAPRAPSSWASGRRATPPTTPWPASHPVAGALTGHARLLRRPVVVTRRAAPGCAGGPGWPGRGRPCAAAPTWGDTSTHSSSPMNSSACSSESWRCGVSRSSSSAVDDRTLVSFFSLVGFTSISSAREFSPTIIPS